VSLLVCGSATVFDLAYRLTAGVGLSINWGLAILTFLGSLAGQVCIVIAYWYRKEHKNNADAAVHGKTEAIAVAQAPEES
jgi:hypothetical protein